MDHKDEPANQPKRSKAAGWQLWSRSGNVVAFVLVVDAVAVACSAATAVLFSVDAVDLIRLGVLVLCAWVHLEATRRIELRRKTAWKDGTAPHLDLRTVWNFAALLLLPPALATAMTLLTSTYVWLRVRPGGQRRPPHRVAFSTATILIANHVALMVLILAPGPFPGIPSGALGMWLIITAAVLRWLVNFGLVVGVIILTNPTNPAATALGPLHVQALEAGAVSVAVAASLALLHGPWLLIILVVGLVVFHKIILMAQLQHEARTDDLTGLLRRGAWTEDVKRELARIWRTQSTLGVLVIDIDHFKQINDTHGHPAGDIVLRAVTKALRAEIRVYDYAGRWGGDELVIAVPDISGADLYAMATRLRGRVSGLRIAVPHSRAKTPVRVTVSIGAALYPQTIAPAQSPLVSEHEFTDEVAAEIVDEIVRAADSAAYQAKEEHRDRVVIVPQSLEEHHIVAGSDPGS